MHQRLRPRLARMVLPFARTMHDAPRLPFTATTAGQSGAAMLNVAPVLTGVLG